MFLQSETGNIWGVVSGPWRILANQLYIVLFEVFLLHLLKANTEVAITIRYQKVIRRIIMNGWCCVVI